ncbi:MAG: DUF3795 domain-containing protein [Clostridiales bacterium]|nr:DUF3795 domain-containing protein [Clostridiales bacterium]
MNKDWSDKNKKMQTLIGKEATFPEGIDVLIDLRNDLFEQITSIAKNYPAEAFYLMPFAGADGYHSKTLIYSMWHIFRIEDIVAHELIAKDEQVLFTGNWLKKTKSPIITTGNELHDEGIAEFSKKLDVKAVYEYCRAVMESSNEILKKLTYKDLKRTFTDADKKQILKSKSVSTDESAVWLIDYWCDKDVKGLLKMPFSRHWIMHIEAMCRITNKLCQKAKKGVDQIAYCGLSCAHCFLKDWCGSCRTKYNTCSYAKCSPDGVCPNAACCREKGLDGCYECDDIRDCKHGFYSLGKEVHAIKSMSLFIRKYGKKEVQTVLENLHKKQDFEKIQEVLGDDIDQGLRILEENR